MKQQTLLAAITMITSVLFTSCDKDNDNDYTPAPPVVNSQVFTATGDVAGVTAKLDEFRNILGATLNNAPGATGGRREVNWDGVPPGFSNQDNFPFDFFGSADAAAANGRKRGLLTNDASAIFRVDSTDFSQIDASYADQFNPFSGKRTFIRVGSNITECTFKVPGTLTNAFVKGFGVVFSDVDNANSTTIEFFNGTKSLGVFKAPVANAQFSLLGVFFPDEKITKVKIVSGNGVLAAGVKDVSSGAGPDLVVMDDFLYDEPKTIQ